MKHVGALLLIIKNQPLENDRFVINKSRYDSIDSYLSNDTTYKAKYDDIDLVYDHDVYNTLTKDGVDDKLAKHIAHLFIRDPLVIFKELLDLDDQKSSDHFEVRQHTHKDDIVLNYDVLSFLFLFF